MKGFRIFVGLLLLISMLGCRKNTEHSASLSGSVAGEVDSLRDVFVVGERTAMSMIELICYPAFSDTFHLMKADDIDEVGDLTPGNVVRITLGKNQEGERTVTSVVDFDADYTAVYGATLGTWKALGHVSGRQLQGFVLDVNGKVGGISDDTPPYVAWEIVGKPVRDGENEIRLCVNPAIEDTMLNICTRLTLDLSTETPSLECQSNGLKHKKI